MEPSRTERKKSKQELVIENRLLRQWRVSEAWTNALRAFFKYGSYVAIAYFLADAVKELAGKTTLAHILFGLMGGVSLESKVSWGIAAVCFVWASIERHLRRHKTKYLTERLRKIEKMIDPGRTTSHLTPYGDTNPND